MNNKYIWIYGENYALTSNNNSFCMWKHVLPKNGKSEILNYFVAEKNEDNLRKYNTLNDYEKKFFVWKNSKKHYKIYSKADLCLVTLSYKDVMPDKLLWKNIRLPIDKPIIYLQHGTLAMKKIDYRGASYNNNMYKFLYYNRYIKQNIIDENDFCDYQLYYAEFHPRYKELIRKERLFEKKNQILFFLTWREYFGDNEETQKFIDDLEKFLADKKLNKYLEETSTHVKVCLHSFFEGKQIEKIRRTIKLNNVDVVSARTINVMDELLESKLLVTDYSSVGFDFTLLNRPVLLYQPDFNIYIKGRELYCDKDELEKNSIRDKDILIQELTKDKWEINRFFRNRLPEKIDYEYLLQGKHIDKIYSKFVYWQKNKLTFIGYDFDEGGNEIDERLKKIMESMMNKGCMVQVKSLVSKADISNCPNGINYQAFYNLKYISRINKLKYVFLNILCKKSYLKYDVHNIKSCVCHLLKKWIENDNSKVIVSACSSVNIFLARYNKISGKEVIYINNNYNDIDVNKEKQYKIVSDKYNICDKVCEQSELGERLNMIFNGVEESL